jgi:hypothetical protein
MNSRNYKYALLLVAAVSITATGAMSQAYAQSVEDGMDMSKEPVEFTLATLTNVGMMMAKAACYLVL